jgi:hypothetical protein
MAIFLGNVPNDSGQEFRHLRQNVSINKSAENSRSTRGPNMSCNSPHISFFAWYSAYQVAIGSISEVMQSRLIVYEKNIYHVFILIFGIINKNVM